MTFLIWESTSLRSLKRFSSDPHHSSVLWLINGERNWLNR